MKKQWPQKIILNITYRQDSFAIPNAGFYIILDDQLQVLRVDKMAYDAVVLEGITFKEFKIGKKISVDQAKILERTVSLKQLMQKSHITFMSKIELSNGNLMVYTKQGLKGSFGDGKNLEARFNNFVDIYDNLETKGIKTGLIDVSSDGLPTYKPFGK
jgi:cell division protein FtsQ